MSTTFKMIEVVGTSPESYAVATRNAVAEAAKSIRGVHWLEVTNLRGRIQDGKVAEYQVTIKVGFKLVGQK